MASTASAGSLQGVDRLQAYEVAHAGRVVEAGLAAVSARGDRQPVAARQPGVGAVGLITGTGPPSARLSVRRAASAQNELNGPISATSDVSCA